MKNRLLAPVVAVALAAGSVVAVPPSSTLAETATMASQITPRFEDLPVPFLGPKYSPNSVSTYLEIDDDRYYASDAVTEVRLVEDNQLKDVIYRDPVKLKTWGDRSVAFEVKVPEDAPARWNETFEFLVVYSDGSSERFKQTFTIEPADSIRYEPYLDDLNYPSEETVIQEIRGLPEGAKVELLGTKEDWKVVQLDQRHLRITVPLVEMQTQDTISLTVQYPDGTAEIVDIVVSGWDPDWGMTEDPEPEPTPTTTVTSEPTVTVTEYYPEVSVTTEARVYEVPGPTVTATKTLTETTTTTDWYMEPYPEYVTETVTTTTTETETYPEYFTVESSPEFITETVTETVTKEPEPGWRVEPAPVTVTKTVQPSEVAIPKVRHTTTTTTVPVTETATVTKVVATPTTKVVTKPAENSGSPIGTGGIIGIILGVLAALGVGAVVGRALPPEIARALPF